MFRFNIFVILTFAVLQLNCARRYSEQEALEVQLPKKLEKIKQQDELLIPTMLEKYLK